MPHPQGCVKRDRRNAGCVREVADIGGHHPQEVEHALTVPQTSLLGKVEEARVHNEVVRVLHVHVTDDEVVRDHRHVAVRYSPCHPQGAALALVLRAGRLWQTTRDVEDPGLARHVRHRGRLAGAGLPRVLAIEAILRTQLAHGLHRAAGGLAALEGDGDEAADAEQRPIIGVAVHLLHLGVALRAIANQEGGARGLTHGHTLLVHQRVGRLIEGVRVLHLRDVAKEEGLVDACPRLVLW
mmetsp:Transcript_97171/g.251364  ORF Transcript_97171/g.251364 Transcript_97171/m.251364 type:complete len:240 (+) Transcript_97171:1128-1847(+)